MVEWHHWLDGHEFEQALGVGDGQVCCSPCGHKESDTTKRLNWTEYTVLVFQNKRLLIFCFVLSVIIHINNLWSMWGEGGFPHSVALFFQDIGLPKLTWTVKPGIRGVAKSETHLSDWTELKHTCTGRFPSDWVLKNCSSGSEKKKAYPYNFEKSIRWVKNFHLKFSKE